MRTADEIRRNLKHAEQDAPFMVNQDYWTDRIRRLKQELEEAETHEAEQAQERALNPDNAPETHEPWAEASNGYGRYNR